MAERQWRVTSGESGEAAARDAWEVKPKRLNGDSE